MNGIRKIQELSQQELEHNVSESASWHSEYSDTGFIFIGGLPFDMKEEDVLTIFSQYGNPIFIKLVRDKETGESKGFCFLEYEDKRSAILAVDNFNGIKLLGRTIKVDHSYYKPFTSEDPEEMEKERIYQERMSALLNESKREHPEVFTEDHKKLEWTEPKEIVDDDLADPMEEYIRQKAIKKSHKKDCSKSRDVRESRSRDSDKAHRRIQNNERSRSPMRKG